MDKIKSLAAAAALSLVLDAGCENKDNTAGKDYGDNDPNLVACMGDSLTMGYMCDGAPYPQRIAEKTGKNVINYGIGGVKSDTGASLVSSVVARKPAYVCILYGSNDAISYGFVGPEGTVNNLRRVVNVCRANNCIPIIATIPPMNGSHAIFNGNATVIADAIREFAKLENVCYIDLNKAFGDGEKHLNPADGLHFNDAGGELVAKKFAAKIP